MLFQNGPMEGRYGRELNTIEQTAYRHKLKKMYRKKFYSPAETARLLGVSPVTVRNWARKGDLVSHSTPGGHRRFLIEDIQSFARRNGMTLFQDQQDRQRILVVEDDRQFSAFIGEVLQSLAPTPMTLFAYDGFEAGRLLQSFQPHLVLLDLMLPGVDGISICRRLRKAPETRSIRIIAMTGYDSPVNVIKVLDAGADSCLSKPFSVLDLTTAINGDAAQPLSGLR